MRGVSSLLALIRFQSTHSLRSATHQRMHERPVSSVSIHALLAECDPAASPPRPSSKCFNPRTPCGVRLDNLAGHLADIQFQSTHSLRSATWHNPPPLRYQLKFQSTHSLRSATEKSVESLLEKTVSIHALLAECD